MEEWVTIPEFPDYKVSNHGRVMNRFCDIRKTSINQSGFDVIVFSREGVHYARALHKLVAVIFLGDQGKGFRPVHIDGDRRNNRADNLEWVPARYVTLGHRQERRSEPVDSRGIVLMETGDRFRNALECGRAIGKPEDVVLDYAYHTEAGEYDKMYHRGNVKMGIPPGDTQVSFTP